MATTTRRTRRCAVCADEEDVTRIRTFRLRSGNTIDLCDDDSHDGLTEDDDGA